MKNEKVIGQLKDIAKSFPQEYFREWREALDIAIKLVEQQPCEGYDYKALWEQVKWERDIAIEQLEQLGYSLGEKIRTSEDCVSREEVLKHRHVVQNNDWIGCCVVRVDEITKLPSVTPQPKTGHWIDGNPICPCCGEDKFKDLDADIWADWQPKYCPNCGSYNGGIEKCQ